MTESIDEVGNKKPQEPSPMYEVSRRILLATIGVIALAQDEVEQFINRLVDRGEIAEKEGKQLVKEMMEKRKERQKKIQAELNKRFSDAMERLDLPKKKDIEELSAKLAELTRKVEELKKPKE